MRVERVVPKGFTELARWPENTLIKPAAWQAARQAQSPSALFLRVTHPEIYREFPQILRDSHVTGMTASEVPNMSQRRMLGWPITLAVLMIAMVVTLVVGWVLLAVNSAMSETTSPGIYWAILVIGSLFFALILAGTITYLVLTIKAINLSQRQSNFIDSVTHELKSPIASLKLYLQTLTRHKVTEQQKADFYRFMLADVERLDQLINHLLEAARVESGAAESEANSPEVVPLEPLLRECAHLACLRHHVEESIVQIDPLPWAVRGRRGDIEIIFRNLLDNAVKYAAEQPQVTVQSRWTFNGKVEVSIADNGRGIPPNLRRKIFGRFARLGSELERDKPGTGLGLYIVRTLVQRWQGKIIVRDRSGGSGTVFVVQLPGEKIAPMIEGANIHAGRSSSAAAISSEQRANSSPANSEPRQSPESSV